jgi:hypothetical protein
MEFAATFGAVLLYGALSILLGQESVTGSSFVLTAVFAACYSALLTPFLYPVVRGLGSRFRPASVIR